MKKHYINSCISFLAFIGLGAFLLGLPLEFDLHKQINLIKPLFDCISILGGFCFLALLIVGKFENKEKNSLVLFSRFSFSSVMLILFANIAFFSFAWVVVLSEFLNEEKLVNDFLFFSLAISGGLLLRILVTFCLLMKQQFTKIRLHTIYFSLATFTLDIMLLVIAHQFCWFFV